MHEKSLFNPKKVLFRLNDGDFFLSISLVLAVLDIDVAQLLHLVSEISDMDSPPLSIWACLYICACSSQVRNITIWD